MELDLQSLFGLHVHSCTYWLRPYNPPPRIWAQIRGRCWSTKIDDKFCDPLSTFPSTLFCLLIWCRLLFIVFPFPPSKAKLIGDVPVNRQTRQLGLFSLIMCIVLMWVLAQNYLSFILLYIPLSLYLRSLCYLRLPLSPSPFLLHLPRHLHLPNHLYLHYRTP